MAGLPPAYLKLGKIVIYEEEELDRFLAACRRRSTSEPDHAQQREVDAISGHQAANKIDIPENLSRAPNGGVTTNAAGRFGYQRQLSRSPRHQSAPTIRAHGGADEER